MRGWGGRPLLLLRHGWLRTVLPSRRERETRSGFQESAKLRNSRVHQPRPVVVPSVVKSVFPSLAYGVPADCSEPAAAALGASHPSSARWLWIHCLARLPANVCKMLTTNRIEDVERRFLPKTTIS